MSRFASPKTARIRAEWIALGERSNAPVARFCQSVGCSPTSCCQWQRKLAAYAPNRRFSVCAGL